MPKKVRGVNVNGVIYNLYGADAGLFSDVSIALIDTSWTKSIIDGKEVWLQNVTVEGATDKSSPVVILYSGNKIATKEEMEAFGCLSEVITSKDNFLFVAERKPEMSFTVICKGAIAAQGSQITDLSALVAKTADLEAKMKEMYKDMYVPDVNIYEIKNETAFRNGDVTFNFPHELDLSKTQIKILSVMAKTSATGEWTVKNVGIWWIIKEITSTSITLYFSGNGIDANQFYRALVEVTEHKKPTE